jgi:hypothetical protein
MQLSSSSQATKRVDISGKQAGPRGQRAPSQPGPTVEWTKTVPVHEAVGTRCLPPLSGRAMRVESDVTQATRPRGNLSGQGTVVSRQVRDVALMSGRTVPSCITPCFGGMRVSQTTPAGRQGSAVSGQDDMAIVTRRSALSRVNVNPDDKNPSTSMRVDGDALEAAWPLATSMKPVSKQPKVACVTAGATMRGEDEGMKCEHSENDSR